MPESALLKQSVDQLYPVAARGRGVFLYDEDGRDWLDGASGAMTASIGHGVESVADAVREQARTLAFSYRTQFTNEPAEELARRLVELAPGDLDHAFFVNSGSEATEFAIRAAVNHWREHGEPRRVKVLGRHLSYHGMTMGSLSMSGHPARRQDYGSLLHAFPVGPPAYPYRFAHDGESEDDYAARSIAEFESALRVEGSDTVAAVIVEPIVGAAGGVLVPPTGYLRRLRELCDRLGILLIADEVITGIGRTGAWFACADEGVVPDLLVTGKGLSGGYAPVAAVLLRRHLVETMRRGSGMAPFGHTFSGNPLGAATCLAVLDVLQQADAPAAVVRRGAQLEAGLRKLEARLPHMVDVRGRGLLWGFEFVLDPDTREAPAAHREASSRFVELCFDAGLIVYPAGIRPLNNAAMVCPPLTIAEGEVRTLLARLEPALHTMDALLEQWRADAAA